MYYVLQYSQSAIHSVKNFNLEKLWNIKVTAVAIITEMLEIDLNSLKNPKEFENLGRIKAIHKTALLKSRILRLVLNDCSLYIYLSLFCMIQQIQMVRSWIMSESEKFSATWSYQW